MRSWTAPTTLNLTTPAAVQHGLNLIGLNWAVSDHDYLLAAPEPLLYAWVDGRSGAPTLSRGILYEGINASASGVNNRLRSERHWADGAYIHGLALATRRLEAVAVSGTVTQNVNKDLTWMDAQFDPNDKLPAACQWLLTHPASPVRKAEHIAIRLAVHIGDTGNPVNSQHNGAWEQKHPADLLAYRIAAWMDAHLEPSIGRAIS